MQIAIDTGGTFTDCVYRKNGRLRVLKVPSTPADPGAAVLSAVREITGGEAAEVRHGTTVGTNALLERKGARVAFVTTAGFEDTIAIGRQTRPELYNLFFEVAPPLAPTELRFGVQEHVAADGSILKAPSNEELEQLRDKLAALQVEAVAISLLFSFANPTNEIAVQRALEPLGVPLSVSHLILPEFREFERGSTILINAYLAPKMQRYLSRLDTALDGKLAVMQSSGGIVDAQTAAREPVRTILSGPAGGVVGASALAREAGYERILTFDMGGTSTDVALVDLRRELQTTTESSVMGMPVAVPTLNIHTVGAGGGSIARFDVGGALQVGPESAGADPGPICYGKGERPTVTDANLLLGRLGRSARGGETLLAGQFDLHREPTVAAFEKGRGRLPSPQHFAEGIVRVVNAVMEKALRRISIEAGHDPREFVLVSFGGAGPLHACELARALRIPTVLVPRMPGALSAAGILLSEEVRDFSRTVMCSPEDSSLENWFGELETRARQVLPEGVLRRSLDMRYRGQGYELRVPWSPSFVESFHEEHARRYGYSDRAREVEVVNLRVRASVLPAVHEWERCASGSGDLSRALIGKTSIFAEGEWQPASVYARERLAPGDVVQGASIVTEYSATTFLPSYATARVDEFENLVVTVDG